MDLVWLWAACLLILGDRFVVLFCWSVDMGYPALELAGPWVELGLCIDMEALDGHSFINVL